MELPVPNSSMHHREPKSEIDDTGLTLQGASCTIAAGAAAAGRSYMVQEVPCRNHAYHRFHFKSSRWCIELLDIGGSMRILVWELFHAPRRNTYLTA